MAESFQDTVDRLTAFINQSYADIETGPGSVISELLLKLAAKVQNPQYNKISELEQGSAITTALSSTTDVYSPVIDLVASNYNTTRSLGLAVTGRLKITVSSDSDKRITAGTVFIQPSLNLNYICSADTTASISPSVILEEIQLYGNQGLYYFIVPVEAVTAGPEYQVPSGTVFTTETIGTITDLVGIEAYGNFSSGAAPETDKELVAKFKANLGNSRLESPAGISKRFSAEFPGFQGLSVCGANDAEMRRSRENALGISTFGKADVYVRSSVGPEVASITKAAKQLAADLWEIDIRNSDVAGFYNVKAIIPVIPNVNLGGTLVVTSTEYYTAFYTGERNNELATTADSRFTKYQAARIKFNYTYTPTSASDTAPIFDLLLNYQPNILEMQNLLLSDTERLACADYLVKAVVPCMVSLDINLVKKRYTDTFESLKLQKLKQDIFTYINTIPFGGVLQASSIVNICHNYDIRRVDLPISMTANILCPDGTTLTLTDSDIIEIPNLPLKGVTPKTAAYFIDYYRVDSGSANPIDNIGLNIA